MYYNLYSRTSQNYYGGHLTAQNVACDASRLVSLHLFHLQMLRTAAPFYVQITVHGVSGLSPLRLCVARLFPFLLCLDPESDRWEYICLC